MGFASMMYDAKFPMPLSFFSGVEQEDNSSNSKTDNLSAVTSSYNLKSRKTHVLQKNLTVNKIRTR